MKPTSIFDTFHYGCDYYPEAWDESRWPDDLARMAAAGFNVIRIGEGAWSYWEPTEGQFQFELFDRVIALCKKHKIKVIMGTPTYAAPAWVSTKYPEVLRKDFNRIPMKHGGRRNLNYTSAKYFDLSDKLCTALAEHYKNEKQIIAWQLDNEFNCHMDVSYAESDTIAFRAWLKQRYKTIAKLNAAWGTSFWSHTYNDFDQIDMPHPTAAYMNPHQILDETRFISDCVVRFAARQAAIMRKHNPRWPITTNGIFGNIDAPALAGVMDFWSHDQYPLFYADGDWAAYGSKLVEARSLSQPFTIMEQQSGPGGQMSYLLRTPRPGEIRQWTWQSIAHGAGAFLYFRWRTCPFGSEQHWHGLIEPDNRDTRRLAEAKQTGEEIRRLPRAFFESKLAKAVGVLRDFDSESNDRRVNTYTKEAANEHRRWCQAFERQHVPTDYVWPTTDFAGYKLIIAPHSAIITPAMAKKFTAFVKAGGTLVLGAQTGTMTIDLHLIDQPAPGVMRTLAGIEVDEWTTLPLGEPRHVNFADGSTVALNTFVERLRLTTAKPLATWAGTDPLLANSPAVTIRKSGKGQTIYFAGYALDPSLPALTAKWLELAGIKPIADVPPEVEILDRRAGNRRFIAILNYAKTEKTVTALPTGKDLLTGQKVDGNFTLPPFGVAIVETN